MQYVHPCVAFYLIEACKKTPKKNPTNKFRRPRQARKQEGEKKSLSDLLPQEFLEENTVQFYTSICRKSDKPTKKCFKEHRQERLLDS